MNHSDLKNKGYNDSGSSDSCHWIFRQVLTVCWHWDQETISQKDNQVVMKIIREYVFSVLFLIVQSGHIFAQFVERIATKLDNIGSHELHFYQALCMS